MNKIGFDWGQESTKRGVAMAITGILGLLGVNSGIDEGVVLNVITIGSTIVGALGAFRKD